MFQMGWKQTSRTLILQSGHFNNQFLVYQPSMKTYRFVLPSPNTPCQNWRLEPKIHSTFQKEHRLNHPPPWLWVPFKRPSFSRDVDHPVAVVMYVPNTNPQLLRSWSPSGPAAYVDRVIGETPNHFTICWVGSPYNPLDMCSQVSW